MNKFTQAPITSFSNQYFFLSNFFPVEIEFDGEIYPSVEHAFQAAKTFDPTEREKIRKADTPALSKRLGKKVSLRDDWENVKKHIMYQLIQQKFSINFLREKLIETKDSELIEGNVWNDVFWGMCIRNGKYVGANNLGKILMQIRHEIM